jgi:hypothetical protein
MKKNTSLIRLGKVIAFTTACLAVEGVLLAQYQVNNQIYGNSAPPPRFANTVAGETNYLPSSSNWMPSEARNEAFKSGLTPSQLRGNYMAVGPLAPNAQSYIHPVTEVPDQGVDSRMPTQSNYQAPSPSRQITPSAAAIPSSRLNTGSAVITPAGTTNVRYNPPGLSNSTYNGSGSIRYGQ